MKNDIQTFLIAMRALTRATGAFAGVPSRQASAFLSNSSIPCQVVLRVSWAVRFLCGTLT